jgi:glyoxylase-like metal-dependent hydrolase (beta-lactamase superfamily II)
LKANGIEDPSQITHLVISHWHIDHSGQIGLFPNAKLITPELVRDKEVMIGTEFGLPNGIEFAFHIGHSCGDLVVKVKQKRFFWGNLAKEY